MTTKLIYITELLLKTVFLQRNIIIARRFGFLVFLIMASMSAQAENNTMKLECADPRNKGVEANLIRSLASGVAIRKSSHQLQIKTDIRVMSFLDEPPYDEPIGGKHYYFCDRKSGFILLTTLDSTDFTGTLINEKTGAVSPGGETIIFSIDNRAYFLSEHSSGMDGDKWKIYSMSGKLSWEGYNFIPREDNQSFMYAYLNDPTWSPSGEFTATAQCTKLLDKTWRVTLKKIKGAWDWSPKRKCE